MPFRPVALALPLCALALSPAHGQARFDPFAPCATSLAQADTPLRPMIAGWVLGYMEAGLEARSTFALDEGEQVLGSLQNLCQSYPERSLAEIVLAIVTLEKADQTAAAEPGSEEDARALLSRFLDPATDRVALTASLLPSPEDIRAVYDEPLASGLIAAYEGRLVPGVEIGPGEGQSTLLTWAASTGELRAGGDAMRYFPMGYRDVAQYMKPGLTMLRFKFVRPGESSGMAYDGLVWVNGRWVWIPKPWRGLE